MASPRSDVQTPPVRSSSAVEHDCAEAISSDLMTRPTSEWHVAYASAERKNKSRPTVISANATRTNAGFLNMPQPCAHVEAVQSVQWRLLWAGAPFETR